jgi:glycogen synthase
VPVVATRAGGVPEIIDDGVTGRLVAPESPSQLAEAAGELLDSPSLRIEMGKQAREAVCRRFTVQAQAQRYLELYEQLIAKSSHKCSTVIAKEIAAARSRKSSVSVSQPNLANVDGQ